MYNRKEVYKLTKYGDDTRHMLVLNSSGSNITIIPIIGANENDTNFIKSLLIEGIGMASIDAILTRHMNWFVEQNPVLVRELSNNEYMPIIDCVRSLFSGEIISIKKGIINYNDAISIYNEPQITESAEVDTNSIDEEKDRDFQRISKFIEMYIEFDKDGGLYLSEVISKYDNEIGMNMSAYDFSKYFINICSSKFGSFRSKRSISPNRNVSFFTRIKFIDIIEGGGECKNDIASSKVYYDLIKSDEIRDIKYTKNAASVGTVKKTKSNNIRHLFSEEETIDIACMTINMIMLKYNVTVCTAGAMLNNAKEIVEGTSKIIKEKNNDYLSLWRRGFNLDNVLSQYPKSKHSSIKQSYDNYITAKDNSIDNDAAIKRWESYLVDMSLEDLCKYCLDISLKDFAKNEHCSVYCARNITQPIIINTLYKNPYAVIFGSMAFDKNFDSTIKEFKNNQRNASNRIDVDLYDRISSVYDIYVATFNDHLSMNVSTGKFDELTEGMSDYNKDTLRRLIAYRFNTKQFRYNVISKQLFDSIKDLSVEGIAYALMLRYNKAMNAKNKIKYTSEA